MIGKEELNTCQKRVELLLKNNLECRNSDKYLISTYLKEFHSLDIPPDVLSELPAFESITRARRKLQEDGDYPAVSEIESKRKEQQTEVIEWAIGR